MDVLAQVFPFLIWTFDSVADDQDDCEVQVTKLPGHTWKSTPLKAAAVQCREKLAQLTNMTYLCQNADALQHLADLLDAAAEFKESSSHKHQEAKKRESNQTQEQENPNVSVVKKLL